ncbi:MAG TPA: alpha/beta fold hydrolase [Polyangia bacterium]|jgi:pimeloyl-ACP methyl ester carboxylesterase
MRLGDVATLSALLARIARGPRTPDRPDPSVVEDRDREGGGLRYDWYASPDRLRGAVIALHGVTVNGARDHRLVHFARCLARARVACAVPTLPGLAACRVEARDVDLLGGLVASLGAAGHRPGLIGFSYGGSYALAAAARPALAASCRFVLTFGAYHRLDDLMTERAAARDEEPATAAAWDDAIYERLVLAHGYPDAAALPPAAQAEAAALLGRYCHAATPEEKRAFYERHLRGLDLPRLHAAIAPAAVAAVSPGGALGAVRCPVSLVHDRDDSIIAPAHAERLHAELRAAAPAGSHRLLVTALLSHVDLRQALRPGDVGRLYAALAPILAAD